MIATLVHVCVAGHGLPRRAIGSTAVHGQSGRQSSNPDAHTDPDANKTSTRHLVTAEEFGESRSYTRVFGGPSKSFEKFSQSRGEHGDGGGSKQQLSVLGGRIQVRKKQHNEVWKDSCGT